jgi:hypothetical protein
MSPAAKSVMAPNLDIDFKGLSLPFTDTATNSSHEGQTTSLLTKSPLIGVIATMPKYVRLPVRVPIYIHPSTDHFQDWDRLSSIIAPTLKVRLRPSVRKITFPPLSANSPASGRLHCHWSPPMRLHACRGVHGDDHASWLPW